MLVLPVFFITLIGLTNARSIKPRSADRPQADPYRLRQATRLDIERRRQNPRLKPRHSLVPCSTSEAGFNLDSYVNLADQL